MSRLLPLLALAFVPALVAAPVPRDTRPAFGANGLLSRADLEQVRFDSRLIKTDDRDKQQAEEKPAQDEVDEVKRADEPEKPRPANKFDVAVHMPWTVFREGEPIPAYLVLRNNRPSTLGLTSRIDLSGTFPEMQGGATSFDVRDRATGKSVLIGMGASTNCGGGSLIDVPADGYFVTRGDLNRLTGGRLAPGDYEVEWSYRPLRSAPVRFSVTKSDAPKPPAAKRPTVHHFYHLSRGFERERLQRIDEPHVWRDCHLNSEYPDSMAAALAVGQNGAYIPDPHTIPTADKLVEAWVEWHPYREGDRLVVTLRAVAPHKEVQFDEMPQLHLQIESPRGEGDRHGSWLFGEAKEGDRVGESLSTPLTIEARLPADWRERVGVTGTARVAVLVTSKRLELPTRGGQRLEKLKLELDVKRVGDFERPPVWSGTVRSDFIELQFPPLPPGRVVYLRPEDLPDGPILPGD
jgi:hypothetical protein